MDNTFVTAEEVKDWFDKSDLNIYTIFADMCNEYSQESIDLFYKWIKEKQYE